MPLVATEEGEERLEGRVGDVDAGVVALQFLRLEEAAVEVRHVADESAQARVAGDSRRIQSLMEQPPEELAVERVKAGSGFAVPELAGRYAPEPVLQIRWVAIEEVLLLDEIDEHQPVEHQRGVLGPLPLVRQPLDEPLEHVALCLEVVVELFRDLVSVEGLAESVQRRDQPECLLLLEREGDRLEALDQVLGLPRRVLGLADPDGLALLPRGPLPDLPAKGLVVEDDQVQESVGGQLALDSAAGDVVGKLAVRAGRAGIDHDLELLDDGSQGERPRSGVAALRRVQGDGDRLAADRGVPAAQLAQELPELPRPDELIDLLPGDVCRHA